MKPQPVVKELASVYLTVPPNVSRGKGDTLSFADFVVNFVLPLIQWAPGQSHEAIVSITRVQGMRAGQVLELRPVEHKVIADAMERLRRQMPTPLGARCP